MNIKHLHNKQPPLCFFNDVQPLVNQLHAEGRAVKDQRDALALALRAVMEDYALLLRGERDSEDSIQTIPFQLARAALTSLEE